MTSDNDYIDAQQKLLNQLEADKDRSFKTRRELILRLKEMTYPLIQSGYYKNKTKKDLSSIIWGLLEEREISYDRSNYAKLFDDDEKGNQGKSGEIPQKISPPLPIEKQTGFLELDELKRVERGGFIWPNNYRYGDQIDLISDVEKERLKQTLSLKNKLGNALAYAQAFNKTFPDDSDFQAELERSKGNKRKELETRKQVYEEALTTIEIIEGELKVDIEPIKEKLAELRVVSDKLDERKKISFIEKWNALTACAIDETKSHIAKMLGVDKKHMTNSVIPERNPVTDAENTHHNLISRFKAMKWVCTCGQENITDVEEYFNKEIERHKLGLPFKAMILKNCDVC